MRHLLFATAFILPLLQLSAHAQGAVTTASVAVAVSETGDTWRYEYRVRNSDQSTATACWIDLDISIPHDSATLDESRLLGKDLLAALLTRRDAQVKAVPVSPSAPEGWVGATGGNGLLRWMAIDSVYELRPGAEVSRLVVTSPGLPTIRTMVVSPFVDINSDAIPEEASEDLALMEKLRLSLSGVVQTIGPTAPPREINNREFLLSVRAHLETATSLNWLSRGIARSLEAKLNAALASIGRGNARAAQNQLGAARAEIAAQRGKQIPEEVATLIDANIAYLLAHWAYAI